MKAILTRNSDTFIPLRDRMDIAHRYGASLFISIHADANPNNQVSGSSVYILSDTGASSEAARLLAESENSYDLKFGEHNITETNSRLASVLLDLSQNAMMERSLHVANGVLAELAKVNNPLRSRVESAQFVVLRSPDIPSMLVETAFISNPLEEKRLRTADYQQKLASAMFRGVKRYQLAYAGIRRTNT
jgi:N-acetylmuramoyl-L-alanine amidase